MHGNVVAVGYSKWEPYLLSSQHDSSLSGFFFPKQGFFAKQIHCLEFSWTKQATMFSFRCGGCCYVVAKSDVCVDSTLFVKS